MENSQKIDVILLAAGRGVRLGKLTDDLPKCLLPLSNETTILDVYLEFFLPINLVRSICIVGGFAMSSLSNHLVKRWPYEIESGKVILLQNPIFDSTNNIVTFVQSAPFFHSGGILIEADLVCSPDIYTKVIGMAMDHPEKSILVIDESRKYRSDAVRISKHQNGMIDEIGKSVDLEISEGEYLGISYLSAQDAASALEICKNLIAEGKNQILYEVGIGTGTASGRLHLHPVPTNGSDWSEVDDNEDYQRAKALYESFVKM